MKIWEVALAVLGVIAIILLMVIGFNFLHCTPIKILEGLLPKVAVAPVTAVIPPGSTVEYGRNKVKIKPPKALPGHLQLPPKEIWHPVELKPYTDKNGVLHVPQSGFCLVLAVGPKYNFKDPYWELGARVFVLGQLGFEPAGNEKGWSPKLDWRIFDSNILVGAGPDFEGLSFNLTGASISAKFDLGLFQ